MNEPLFNELRENDRFDKILAEQKKLYEYFIEKFGDVESEIEKTN